MKNKEFLAAFISLIVLSLMVLALAWVVFGIKKEVINLKAKLGILEGKTSIEATITAYSPEINQTDSDPYTTAFMTRVRLGTVAVSRDLLNQGWTPGKRVWIEGIGVYTINDIMAKRWKKRFDIFFYATSDAKRFTPIKRRVILIKDL